MLPAQARLTTHPSPWITHPHVLPSRSSQPDRAPPCGASPLPSLVVHASLLPRWRGAVITGPDDAGAVEGWEGDDILGTLAHDAMRTLAFLLMSSSVSPK